jgi:molecular chaperone GrpE
MNNKNNKDEKINDTKSNDSKSEGSIESESDVSRMKNDLQRLQAEFENYRKRSDRDKSEFVKFATRDLVIDLLPVLDNLDLALSNSKEVAKEKTEFVKGIELIYGQFYEVLSKIGLSRIESLGQKFNPYMHEALLQEESDGDENKILEEMQKGYLLNDKVIRHAKVKISKKRDNKGDSAKGDREDREQVQ